MQIDSVARHFAHGIVLTEYELGGLLVVVVGSGGMLLALGAHFVCPRAIAALVGLPRLCGIVLVLALLFTREIAQTVVLLLSARRGPVVEG